MIDYIPISGTYWDKPVLLCPICGCENVHPTGIECLPPGKTKGRVVITADGLMVDPYAKPDNRGVRITLWFVCENGRHEFAYRFHFHKGFTFVRRQEWRVSDDNNPKETIWRD
jgi:hypothetical protein